MAILYVIRAILGHFFRFSPDDHLNICFSDKQDFTESTLVLYILRYSNFKAQYPEKKKKKGNNMHQNGHIAKLSQAKPQLQLSWLALACLNFT